MRTFLRRRPIGVHRPGQAQSAGTVSGQVTDRHDAVVVGAEAVLTDTSTNTAQTTRTNQVGRYIFLNAAPGTYTGHYH
jgi:hypothetical protein